MKCKLQCIAPRPMLQFATWVNLSHSVKHIIYVTMKDEYLKKTIWYLFSNKNEDIQKQTQNNFKESTQDN